MVMRGCFSTLITMTRGYGDSTSLTAATLLPHCQQFQEITRAVTLFHKNFERIRSDSFQIPVAEQALSAMNNLSNTYQSLGKHVDAVNLQIPVLDMRSRSLGEEHPETISAMYNLANIYHCLGKYADAEKLQIKVLDVRSRFLEEHPDTIDVMENLALTFYYGQQYKDAASLEVQVVNVRKKFLERIIHKQSNQWQYLQKLNLKLTQILQELNQKKR